MALAGRSNDLAIALHDSFWLTPPAVAPSTQKRDLNFSRSSYRQTS
jgi:hypothetical protein